MPKVSVIIPSYNHEKYISETIHSVLNQSYQDFEIVITDDYSSDNTIKIIKEFNDPRIRLFCFPKNRGAAVAANNCIQEARGELIAMLSSDDIFTADKLAKQVSYLEENQDVGAVFSYAHIIDDDGNDFNQENHFYKQIFIQPNRNRFEWLNHFFFKGNCLCHPSALVHKKCYDELGKYDERFAQLPDFDFWIRLCMKYNIHIIPEELIKFRIRKNEANASGNRPETRIRHQIECKQILNNYCSPEVRNNFYQIFPEAGLDLNQNQDNEESIYLQLALLAIKVSLPAYQSFGIDKLYELLDTKNNIFEKILQKYAFDFGNLIAITGQYDVYGIISKENLYFELEQSKAELEQSRSQFHQTQTELEQSRSQFQQTQTELEQSRSQFHQTQAELEQSRSQFHQTQAELEQSRSQFHQTQTELEQSRSQFQQTQTELEQSRSQFQQTQIELQRSYSQFQHTEIELERSQSQFQQTQMKLEQLQSQLQQTELELKSCRSELHNHQLELQQMKTKIAAMESSKFWQLRKVWFQVKSTLGLEVKE